MAEADNCRRWTTAGVGDRLPLPHVWFIPAPAGNTPNQPLPATGPTVHPRACGEHLTFTLSVPLVAWASP